MKHLVESRCESSRNVKQSFDDDDDPIGNRPETNLLFVLKELGTQFSNDMAPDITPQYLIFANRNHASADDISHTYVHKGEPYPNYSLR